MAQTFFFYDLETSGIDPVYQRIMQFAGQRTDLALKPMGEPVNVLVKLSDDMLPEPEAVLVHGLSPQKVRAEGISEAQLSQLLINEVFVPGTISVGFNNIRFDDEFVRHLFWRNFYDPYQWQWKDARSRWDLLDAFRLTRALRPTGLSWPVDGEGKPTNRLISLASANNVNLIDAHDALGDISATLELARKLKTAQPKLFNFLLDSRHKAAVDKIIAKQPFVYSSGRYDGEFLKTTVAIVVGQDAQDSNKRLIYDLRYDPTEFMSLDVKQLRELIYRPRDESEPLPRLPVKKLAVNRAPAVAPISTLDEAAEKRIGLNLETALKHQQILDKTPAFAARLNTAFEGMERLPRRTDPEGQLYDDRFGFLGPKDKAAINTITAASPAALAELKLDFIDQRLDALWLRYKARNFPEALSGDEAARWEGWRTDKLINGIDNSLNLAKFAERLNQLAAYRTDPKDTYLLEELKLYAESIAPAKLFD
ncbi:MAG TPA: exodeoxyribonuclease I [Candidatus Saccharimonadales bacterium]